MSYRSGLLLPIALACAACGSAQPHRTPELEWTANARGVIQQLRSDVLVVAGGDQVGAARRTLREESELYAALVAYTDFGGCSHMIAALGTAPQRFRPVERQLARVCDDLERASSLFTQAVAGSSPRLLVAATHSALRAVLSLDHAQLGLTV